MTNAADRRFAIDGRPQGWFTELEAAAYNDAVRRFPGGHMVEVGTWLGRSLSTIMPSVIELGIDVICVDTWEGSDNAKTKAAIDKGLRPFDSFKANMEFLGFWGKFSFMRQASVSAANQFEPRSLDLVMIDAAHEYEAVRDDLRAWLPKIRHNGLIVGHDYYAGTPNPHPGVYRAVQEAIGPVRVFGSLFVKEVTWPLPTS